MKLTPARAGRPALDTHRWTSARLQVALGVATVAEPGAVQYVAYASFEPPGVPAAPGR